MNFLEKYLQYQNKNNNNNIMFKSHTKLIVKKSSSQNTSILNYFGSGQNSTENNNISKNWTITWKDNIFASIQNISEIRGPKYLCSECGEIFNTRLSIVTHSKFHMKPFCLVCGRYTDNQFQMDLHMLEEHPNLVCYKEKSEPFKELDNSSIQSSQNEETNKDTSLSIDLKNDKLLSSYNKDDLNIDLEKNVDQTNITLLDNNANVKEENTTGWCNVTWKENIFATLQNLSEPRGPKYSCDECKEIFNTKLSLITHSKSHLKPFCLACGKYTESILQMEKHMLEEHPLLISCKEQKNYYKKLTKKEKNLRIDTLRKTGQMAATTAAAPTNNDSIIKTDKKPSLRKFRIKCKRIKNIPPVEAHHPYEQNTKKVTSRFGRCITVRMPEF